MQLRIYVTHQIPLSTRTSSPSATASPTATLSNFQRQRPPSTSTSSIQRTAATATVTITASNQTASTATEATVIARSSYGGNSNGDNSYIQVGRHLSNHPPFSTPATTTPSINDNGNPYSRTVVNVHPTATATSPTLSCQRPTNGNLNSKVKSSTSIQRPTSSSTSSPTVARSSNVHCQRPASTSSPTATASASIIIQQQLQRQLDHQTSFVQRQLDYPTSTINVNVFHSSSSATASRYLTSDIQQRRICNST